MKLRARSGVKLGAEGLFISSILLSTREKALNVAFERVERAIETQCLQKWP